MNYVLGGLIGAVVAAVAVEKIWYPPPDLHGVALGLLAAFILYGGAAAGAAVVWAIKSLKVHS